jgi:hypothetical protein
VGKVTSVELLGRAGALVFTQDPEGLKVQLPSEKPGDAAYALKIDGASIKAMPQTAASATDSAK